MRTIQKITIIFLTLLLVGILTINVHASEKITFSIDNLNDVEQGSNITLTLKGENFEDANPKPIGIKLDVFYDADVLEYISAEKGSVVGSTMALHENYTDEGRIRIGIVSFTSIDKSGDLYSIQFKVKDNLQVSNSDVRIEISEVSDSSGNEIDADVKNATITFKGVEKTEQNVENISEISNTETETNGNDEETNNEAEVNVSDEQVNDNGENNNTTKKINFTQQDENISNMLNQNTSLDIENGLEWEIENPEVLEIDEEGNITPKANGTTNVIVRDRNGNEEVITIEVEEQNTTFIIILGIIIIIIIIVIIIIIIKKKRKSKGEVLK